MGKQFIVTYEDSGREIQIKVCASEVLVTQIAMHDISITADGVVFCVKGQEIKSVRER